MASNESVPYWDTGDTITCHAAVAISGKRLVKISGARTEGNPTVTLATGTDVQGIFGVAAYDVASGGKVTVHHQKAIIVPVTAGGTVAAGDALISDSTGRVVKAGTGVTATAGVALDAATVGQDVPVDRSIHAVGA